jgi:hypothetical protein
MRASRLVVVPFLVVVAACGSESAPKRETTAAAAQPIINGQLDTTHDAVVAIALQQGSQGGLCSGTIVKVDPTTHIGWVLTAAHCVAIAPVLVIQSSDIQDPKALQYQIVDYTQDTRYDNASMNAGQPYDFAVIRIAGVDSTTPTIPITGSPDGVALGTQVTMVGYGRTLLNSAGPEDPRYRHDTTQQVANLGSAFGLSGLVLGYNQPTTGTCEGDSGGPDIASGNVVGVHSFIVGDCNGQSASGRVSADLSYISGELAKAAPPLDCTLCDKIAQSGNQECAQLLQACLSDTNCGGFYQCFQNCGGTAACRTTCLGKFPKAEGPLTAAGACSCDRTCKTQCQGHFLCAGVPKCGYAFPSGDCSTCTESTCCQQALDCGADGTCYLCLKNGDKDPACATNAARKTLANCVASSCNTQCANTGLTTGADPGLGNDAGTDPGNGAGGGTTTTTTSGGCTAARTSPRGVPGLPFAAVLSALGLAAGAVRRRRRF